MIENDWKELWYYVEMMKSNKVYCTYDNKGHHINIETACQSCLEAYKNGDLIFTKYNFGKDGSYEEQSFVLKRECNSSTINQIITIFGGK